MRSNSIIAALLVLVATTHPAIATDLAVDHLAAHNTPLRAEENSEISAGIYSSPDRQSTRKDGPGLTHSRGKQTHGLDSEDARVIIFLSGAGEDARDHVLSSSTRLPSSGESGRRVCHRRKQKMSTTGDSQPKHNDEAEEDHGAIAATGPRRICHKKAKPTQIPDQDISQGEGSYGATTAAGPRRVCHKKAKTTPNSHQETSQFKEGYAAITATGPPRVCHKKAKATPISDREPLAGKIKLVNAEVVHIGRCKRHTHTVGSDEFVPGDLKFEDGPA